MNKELLQNWITVFEQVEKEYYNQTHQAYVTSCAKCLLVKKDDLYKGSVIKKYTKPDCKNCIEGKQNARDYKKTSFPCVKRNCDPFTSEYSSSNLERDLVLLYHRVMISYLKSCLSLIEESPLTIQYITIEKLQQVAVEFDKIVYDVWDKEGWTGISQELSNFDFQNPQSQSKIE